MNLYIETKDGVTVNHPAFEDNLIQAFGKIPPHWEPFIRVSRPALNVYEVFESEEPFYGKVDGTWTDVWSVRQMTDEEKLSIQNAVKQSWINRPNASNFTSWKFDEDTCSYIPPIPMPIDDKRYVWRGSDDSWIELPDYPQDGKKYEFDLQTESWIELPTTDLESK